MTRQAYAELLGKHTRKADEDQFQVALVEHLEWRGVPGLVFYMIRNHGKRSIGAMRKEKRMGLRKGASDLGMVIPPHGTAGLLELKIWPNKPTDEQTKFGTDVTAAGGLHAVVYSLDEALAVLTGWGAIKQEKV